MADFRIPEKILYGSGTIGALRELGRGRLLIVSDYAQAGRELQRALSHGGAETRLFLLNRRFADIASVTDGTKALMEFKPEWIAVIGAHAALDCAKLMRIFYEYPELAPGDVFAGKPISCAYFRTPITALPLLHSNGSEATDEAVISNPASGVEAIVKCPGLMPNSVIIDTALLRYATERDDAYAVISSLTLALEAASAVPHSHFSRPLAIEALSIIAGSVMAFSGAPISTEELFYSQFLAGAAHSNTPSGICSAMVHASALALGVSLPYGAAAAIYLPVVLRSGFAARSAVYDGIARSIGLRTGGNAALLLASTVEEYADMLGMPLTLEEFGVDKNLFLKNLSRIVTAAADIAPPSPSDVRNDIEALFREAYDGKK